MNSKIKIGFIINSLRKNGPSRVLINIIKSLNKENYNPVIITIVNEDDNELIDLIKKEKVDIIQLKLSKKPISLLKSDFVSSSIERLNLDCLHIHGHVPLFLCSKAKIKKIVTIHNRLYEDFKVTYGRIIGYLVNIVYQKYLKQCDMIVCCSESSYLIIKDKFKNSCFVRNGINFKKNSKQYIESKRIFIRKSLNIPENSIVYIFAGNFTKTKNVLNLLKEFSEDLEKNEYLILLGKGPLYNKTLRYKSEHIKMLGFKENVEDYMIASDVYVSFSSSEGFSISIIEALNYNLLLLLSDIPSHKECFFIDKTYYLGEYFNSDNFFNIKRNVSNNIGKNNSMEFQKKYLSSDYMTKQYEKIYNKLYNSK